MEASEFLFRNLTQTEGAEVVVSVQVFLERIRQLVAGTSEIGEKGKTVGELLGRRGVTPQVMAEMQTVIDRLAAFQTDPQPTEPTPEQQQAAEDALWSWYLEWSEIARVAIRDRRTLRSLGLLQPQRREEEEETETPAPVPAPSNGTGTVVVPAPVAGV